MLRRDVPLEMVGEGLGHARPSFAANAYRKVDQSEHEERAVNLSELVGSRVMNSPVGHGVVTRPL